MTIISPDHKPTHAEWADWDPEVEMWTDDPDYDKAVHTAELSGAIPLPNRSR